MVLVFEFELGVGELNLVFEGRNLLSEALLQRNSHLKAFHLFLYLFRFIVEILEFHPQVLVFFGHDLKLLSLLI